MMILIQRICMALSGLGRVKITERVMRVSAEMLLERGKVQMVIEQQKTKAALTCSVESE